MNKLIEHVTLWDRVERFLKNRWWVVVILLFVVVVGGVKTCIETAEAIHKVWRVASGKHPDESKLLSCSDLGSIRSGPAADGEETTIHLFNSSNPEPVVFTWVDSLGHLDPDLHFEITRGQYYPEPTFASHVWQVSDATHGCLGLIQLGTRPIVVDEPGKNHKPVIRPWGNAG
jgi:hypothetical protein